MNDGIYTCDVMCKLFLPSSQNSIFGTYLVCPRNPSNSKTVTPNKGAKWELVGEICDFLPICCCIQKRWEIRPRLLLITSRKSYTGFWLAPKARTLDDLERQNRGYDWFFGVFWLLLTFQERIAPKLLEIVLDSLRKKLSALNVVFTSLNFPHTFKEFSVHQRQTWLPLQNTRIRPPIKRQQPRETVVPSGVCASYLMSVAGISELRFCWQWAFKVQTCTAVARSPWR